jgi:hypothetical protein
MDYEIYNKEREISIVYRLVITTIETEMEYIQDYNRDC